MKPEDAFTKKSLKRYKKIRRIADDTYVALGYNIIVGRKRVEDGKSDIVYLEVRRAHAFNEGYTSHCFCFESMPTKREVTQVIRLLILTAMNVTVTTEGEKPCGF